ncbi:MAG: J domain-containing protein [Planctomycetia bacterium]|nr:J domain-containing protein [Planctomycetia bacterium]
MARDYYEVLGVPRKANADEIRKAYRKLAREFHPDRNPGDKQAEARFKEAQEAYDVLSDETKRGQYDRFGHVGPQGFGGGGGGGGGGPRSHSFQWGGGEDVDPNDILRQFFGGGGGGGFGGAGVEELFRGARAGRGSRGARRPEPEEVETEVSIPFLTAARGGTVSVQVNDNRLDVKIPAGVGDGKVLRLQGQAPGGGDLRLKLRIEPHPYFTRDDKDVTLRVPLSLAEAILGGAVDVPTLDGSWATVKVPPGTSTGKKLRLRGKGIDGGDQYIEFQVTVPEVNDDKGKELVRELARLYPQQPRDNLGWGK